MRHRDRKKKHTFVDGGDGGDGGSNGGDGGSGRRRWVVISRGKEKEGAALVIRRREEERYAFVCPLSIVSISYSFFLFLFF